MSKQHQLGARIPASLYRDFAYNAKMHHEHVNEFTAEALRYYLNFIHHNYDLPDAETQRLNQLIHEISQLRSEISGLRQIVTSILNQIATLTNGSNPYRN